MYCVKCGQENLAEAAVCSNCGQPLMVPGAPPPVAVPAAAARAEQVRTDGKATASLVLGVLSLVCGLLAGIPAVILGHISLSNIRKSGGRLKGEGMAMTGLITGYISIVAIPFILIIAAIAIPNLLRSRIAANESSAVGSIRTINVAEVTYYTTYPKAGFSSSLEVLAGSTPCNASSTSACLIDQVLASGEKSGYRFTYRAQDSKGDQVMDAYFVQAVPIQPGTTGRRSLCSDESGVIRYSTTEPCTKESPPL
jgi:type II secretory pathway pseudopilin PulG